MSRLSGIFKRQRYSQAKRHRTAQEESSIGLMPIRAEIQPFQAFPTDIFRIILDFCRDDCEASSSWRGIASLIRTCRLMRVLLEPFLYTNVIFFDFESMRRFPKAFKTARKHTKSISLRILRRTGQEARIIRSIVFLLEDSLQRISIPPGYDREFMEGVPIFVPDFTLHRDYRIDPGPIRCSRLRVTLAAPLYSNAAVIDWHWIAQRCRTDYAFEMFWDIDPITDLEELLFTRSLETYCSHIRSCIVIVYLPGKKAVKNYQHAYRSRLKGPRPQWPFGQVSQRLRFAFLSKKEFPEWTVSSLDARGEDFWDKIGTRIEP